MERRSLEVPPGHSGEAVALILHDGLGVPHSHAKGLIDAGCVTVNGRPVKRYGQRCERGDVVEVRYEPERRYTPSPPTRPGHGFRVVHEDKDIVVVDKMPGILSSPAPGEESDSLAERIADSLKARGFKKPQLFVVHRLDRHTSGLLAFAKTPHALESLTAQFESHEAGRTYAALVEGSVERDRGTIVSWLAEDPRNLSVRTTPLRGAGKKAITHFEVVERYPSATLVRVHLETGRKHQIRVHMAEIGHPIFGDRRYGHASPLVSRVALHAERLTLRHPRGLETVTFEAAWPADFARVVTALRRGAGASHGSAPGQDRILPPSTEGAGTQRDAPAARAAFRWIQVFPEGLTLTEGAASKTGQGETPGTAKDRIPRVVAAKSSTHGPPNLTNAGRPRVEERSNQLARRRAVGHRPPAANQRASAPAPRTSAPAPRTSAPAPRASAPAPPRFFAPHKRPFPGRNMPPASVGPPARAGVRDRDPKRSSFERGGSRVVDPARVSAKDRRPDPRSARHGSGGSTPDRRPDPRSARDGGGGSTPDRRPDPRSARHGSGGSTPDRRPDPRSAPSGGGGSTPDRRHAVPGQARKQPPIPRERHEHGGKRLVEPPRKPWEFKQKGSQRRAERRRKISAARAKASTKGRKP